MTDAELIGAFECCDLRPDEFTHEAHVRVAWWYVTHLSLLEAVATFSTGLRRFAAANGASGKYHETMTVAWMLVIADRVWARGEALWTEFAGRNPDLFVRSPSPLTRFYTDACLASDRARATFVMPDSRINRSAVTPSSLMSPCS